ncbi:hypothetical protein HPB52_025070 [Rhipicephalus sanguineus]|uniref:Uncharacterized protein n=1 Tax=Rhipicephalus sanguineus TaxID=34632 RepID=A0A9D4PBE8_RHISA|nr:hypothetical protein HPB52_025070 [Rhipicephalus sanguineus]
MREPSVKEVSSDSVNHSQSLNRPPVDSWALCKCDGEVVAAHCIRAWPGTAMRAPMSRHCFFYVEYGVRVRQERSCTDSANSWLPTHIRKLDVRPSIAEMDFASSTMKKRRLGADASAARYQSTSEDTGNTVIPPLRYLVRLTGRSEPESPEPRASVADPNASSARPPLRLGMATGTLDAFETTTSSHGEPTPAENMDLTGPGSSTMDGRHDGIADTSRQNIEGRPRTDDDWHTVLTLRQKKQQARERKRGTDATASTSPTKPYQRRRRTPKLPPLPKEDFKIVVRPHQGLPLKTISTPALAEAIVTACNKEIRGE